MSPPPRMTEFGLTNTQAAALAGKRWTIDGVVYRFRDFDPGRRGQPPWKSGAEGKAFPLLGPDGKTSAYLKFYHRTTRDRFERTLFLIRRRVHRWDRSLAAAPRDWLDTQRCGRPPGVGFDFAAGFSQCVPGMTWLEAKFQIETGSLELSPEFRLRCARDLLRALAVLERRGLVHGDLSPNNLIIDPTASPVDPAVSLIDFDAFVALESDEPWARLTVARGGSAGTEGYAPASLLDRLVDGTDLAAVAPETDRHARDILLLELLGFDLELAEDYSADSPASEWGESAARVVEEHRDRLHWIDPARGSRGFEDSSDRVSNQAAAESFGCDPIELEEVEPVDFHRTLMFVPEPNAVDLEPPDWYGTTNPNAPFTGPVYPPGFHQSWGYPNTPGPVVVNVNTPQPPLPAFPAPAAPPAAKRRRPILRTIVITCLVLGFGWLWQLVRWAGVTTLDEHTAEVTGVVFNADGSRLVSCDRRGVVRSHNFDADNDIVLQNLRAPLTCIGADYWAMRVVVGSETGVIYPMRNGILGPQIHAYEKGRVDRVLVSKRGRFAVTWQRETGIVRRWDLQAEQPVPQEIQLNGLLEEIGIDDRANRVFFAGTGSAGYRDFGSSTTVKFPPNGKLYNSLANSADGRTIVASYRDSFGSEGKQARFTLGSQGEWNRVDVAAPSDGRSGMLAMSEGGLYLFRRGRPMVFGRLDGMEPTVEYPTPWFGRIRLIAMSHNAHRAAYTSGTSIYVAEPRWRHGGPIKTPLELGSE
ncbi:MAG: protein kinase family protein [Isosphaeraceae bacterium]|nr:protein kinase family protein [Isosphaeraceae bacterium]